MPKGNEIEDVVQNIILQTISGERNWDPDKGELLPWLKDQVKSTIDALAKSASNRKETFLTEETDSGLTDHEEKIALEYDLSNSQDRLSSEKIILAREEDKEVREIAQRKVTALFKSIDSDAELEEILEAVMNGVEPKPRFLAKNLDIPVEEINNRLKRLRRKAISVLNTININNIKEKND